MEIVKITNKILDLGDADKPMYDIRGAAFDSFNFYKEFADEKTYQAGMMMELQDKGYKVYWESTFSTYYKGRDTGIPRRMDLVVDTPCGTVILELKALQAVNDKERRQLWSYMKQMNCQLGMLINFNPNRNVYTEIWQMDLHFFDFHRLIV